MNAGNEQLQDLLVARATEGLAAEQEREVEQLLSDSPAADPLDMELAAAAAMNAFAIEGGHGADMPAGMKERLLDAARRTTAETSSASVATVTHISERAQRRDAADSARGGSGFGTFNRLGWAAAAMLLVALVVVNRPLPEEPGGAMPDPAEARAELIRETAGTLVVPWSPPDIEAYAGVTGDVVWNNGRQEGYLRLAGLPSNDPALAQYQLWIVDPERDAEPVDGGVFDIPGGAGEVIVPIRAKLGVIDPQAFAITLEKPGGVVVSEGPLLVVASTG